MQESDIENRDKEKIKRFLYEVFLLKKDLIEIQKKIQYKRTQIKKIEEKFYNKIQGKLF